MNTWDITNRDDRVTMAQEIRACLEAGGAACSSQNTYGILPALKQALDDNSDLV